MRQRKVRDLDAKLQAVSAWLVEEPSPEVWDRVFPQRLAGAQTDAAAGKGRARDLYLEIGCGRGDFLLQQAQAHPEHDFIGIEGQASVVLRAMEKAAGARAAGSDEAEPGKTQNCNETQAGGNAMNNIRFVCMFVNDMSELFSPGSLAGIYLNFSDPWPKARHAKRRLTWRGRLEDYAGALQPGGFIAIKTDNDALFEFTLEEIAACGWTPAELTRDLHGDGCAYEARRIMTEYERKFVAAGKNINYVKVLV